MDKPAGTSSTVQSFDTGWDKERMQKEICAGSAYGYLSTVALLLQMCPQAIREFNKIFVANKYYFKDFEIKCPLDLIKRFAEVEVNMFGGDMLVEGDVDRASISFIRCAEWLAIERIGSLTEYHRNIMAEHFAYAMTDLAAEYGFGAEISFDNGIPKATFFRRP